jgi:diketogulonate reductase-like aldo/keto reductase
VTAAAALDPEAAMTTRDPMIGDLHDIPVVEANGARIPSIGLGTWELRGRDCARVVNQAIKLGYRHIDTAQVYENEREVGEGIRASGLPRDEIFVTTKVWTTHFAPLELIRSVQESLARLRVDHADLVLLHWPNPHVPLAETLGALARARETGLTRHVGVSNFTVALMDEAVALSSVPLVCNQVEYHPYLSQEKVREACRRHGMALVAYSPIAKGRIKGDETLGAIASAHRKTRAQVCLRWLVQQGAVAIPRTSKVERLSENIAVDDFVLTDDEMAAIFALGSPSGRLTNFAFAPQWD